MKRSRDAEEQIAFALRQAETGTSVGDVTRKMRISHADILSLERAAVPSVVALELPMAPSSALTFSKMANWPR